MELIVKLHHSIFRSMHSVDLALVKRWTKSHFKATKNHFYF